MAQALAYPPTGLMEEEEQDQAQEQEVNSEQRQKAAHRLFRSKTKKAKKQLQKKAVKLAQKAVAKGSARTAAVSCASTGVGLIITYVIWTGQAIIANWLEKDQFIPKLEWWELILWAIVSVLLGGAILAAIMLLAFAIIFSNPVTGSLYIGDLVWDYVF